MPYIHIIALYEIFVILVTLYFIIKLHFKNNRISKEDDFIDLYEKRRKRLIENAGISFNFITYCTPFKVLYFQTIVCEAGLISGGVASVEAA